MRGISIVVFAVTAGLLAGCNTHQSTLAPFGADAADIRHLFIIMLVGAVVIAAGVALLMRHAVRAPEGSIDHRRGMRIVLWLGGVIPTIVLLGLLAYSLPYMKPRPVSPTDLTIAVDGEQFWWRVAYRPPGRPAVTSANEIRVPVGRTVAFQLTAGDVVHSFWIPGLAGKMDMIPGRTNTLVVRADKPGRYRGQCAEFCGLIHALMRVHHGPNVLGDVEEPDLASAEALHGHFVRRIEHRREGAALFAGLISLGVFLSPSIPKDQP